MVKDDNDNKIDYELNILLKKAQLLLNNNNQISLFNDINYTLESKYKKTNLYFIINKFISNKKVLNKLLNLYNNIIYINTFIIKENMFNDKIDIYNNNFVFNKNFLKNNNKFNLNSKNSISKDMIDDNIYSFGLNENINEKTFNKELIGTNKFLKKKRIIFRINHKNSLYKGVSKYRNKWQVYIRINKKNTYLGNYTCDSC